MAKAPGRVLVIAGSDSGGGAGIQGDLKTITALGGYASTALTALTAQNTQGVFGIHEVPVDFITKQIELVVTDIGADAFKTGMLHSTEVIITVTNAIRPYTAGIPLVLDPVMFAKGGAPLLEESAINTLREYLLPLAAVVTPNIPEAEFLSGMPIKNPEDMQKSAAIILECGASAVLIKGGHLPGDILTDMLVTKESTQVFTSTRIDTPHTHGTGCSLASAIAIGLAQKYPLQEAVARARDYVRKAIEQAPGLGKGHGPLGHGHTVSPSGN